MSNSISWVREDHTEDDTYKDSGRRMHNHITWQPCEVTCEYASKSLSDSMQSLPSTAFVFWDILFIVFFFSFNLVTKLK